MRAAADVRPWQENLPVLKRLWLRLLAALAIWLVLLLLMRLTGII